MSYTEKEKTVWAEQMNQLHKEGAGVWDLFVWFSEDVPWLFEDAAHGDYRSAQMLRTLGMLISRATEQVEEPLQCFCCGAELSSVVIPQAFAVVIPKNDEATIAAGGGICILCADENRQVVLQRALTAWRDNIDPSARALGAVHPDIGSA